MRPALIPMSSENESAWLPGPAIILSDRERAGSSKRTTPLYHRADVRKPQAGSHQGRITGK